MNILRNIVAVILGYATFVISAVLFYQITEIDPHADPSFGTILLTITDGLVFSFIGGYLTHWISNTQKLTINYVLAAIMAGFAAFSMFKSTGNPYSQIAVIFLFAPTSILGGLIYLRKRK